jgi:hypothetical protein
MKAKERDGNFLFKTSRPDTTNRLHDLVNIPPYVLRNLTEGFRMIFPYLVKFRVERGIFFILAIKE